MKHEFNPSDIRLIVGLGNPGKEFHDTYHNAGILFMEASFENIPQKGFFKTVQRKKFMRCENKGKILIKPETFMNESGAAVKNALHYEKIKPEEMMVAHDDNDISIGSFKVDFDRGAAGHNGVTSIIKTLGTKKFWRLRIGIQKIIPGGRKKAGDFVLAKISTSDQKKIETACKNAWIVLKGIKEN